MQIINSPNDLQSLTRAWQRANNKIALVPTMGSLHTGHLALIKQAHNELGSNKPGASKVIVSIFVNPIQFGPAEDYHRYPRNFEHDRQLCEQAEVAAIFHPTAEAMYAEQNDVYVEAEKLSQVLCGVTRPGHFRGVLTVVAKLFNLAQPDVAVFGQKDAQQLRLIQNMTSALNFPVKIVAAPISREPDGLAMSSRNQYLSANERAQALCLVRALQAARNLYRAGEREATVIKNKMTDIITATPTASLEYAQVVEQHSLQPVKHLNQPVLIALAARIGPTRLIDNLTLPDDSLSNLPE